MHFTFFHQLSLYLNKIIPQDSPLLTSLLVKKKKKVLFYAGCLANSLVQRGTDGAVKLNPDNLQRPHPILKTVRISQHETACFLEVPALIVTTPRSHPFSFFRLDFRCLHGM